MMGCLTAPFRLLGCLGLLVALVVGWLYRDRVVREGRSLLGRTESSKPAAGSSTTPRGRPGTRALASAEAKIDSLNGWRADSVVLTASEVASLMGKGLAPEFRQELDSLQVELLQGEVKVHARLRTARLPKEIVGPFAAALGPNEPVEATGPLRVIAPGRGEWAVRSFQIRDFPVPASAVKRLVSGALRDPGRETVPWKVPAGVREVRVRPTGATLYGAPRS
ncbi:MAG TPA: hypothetical protein VMY76_13390 [Gemmatimonadales bacterium]|nr:hypothetical protein [Gemmatimonadales bacterium]